MTATQSLRIYEIIQRYFKNEADAKIVVEDIEQIVADKFNQERKELSSRSEVELMRRDMEVLKIDLSGKIETSTLRVENNLKSEINKLIATVLASGALFITLAKVFFDK